jgi:hypothetical protein
MWLGQLSTLERLSISSFLKNGHPFHLYVYGDVAGVPAGTTIKDGNEILPLHDTVIGHVTEHCNGPYPHGPRCFSNLFRYQLLYARGGYWADLDMVCFKPWDLDTSYVVASDGVVAVGNGVMRTPVGAPIMKAAVERIKAANIQQLKQGQMGPELITELVLADAELKAQVLPPRDFYPIDLFELPRITMPAKFDLEKSYGAHLWCSAWTWMRLDKDGAYPPESLYEQLKRRFLENADEQTP